MPRGDSTLTLDRETIRNVDRLAIESFGFLPDVLMENAGRGCTDVLCELGAGEGVAILCGGGNNGGDGFVIARHLAVRGFRAVVVLLGDATRYSAEAGRNLELFAATGGDVQRRPEASDGSEESVTGWLDQVAGKAAWLVDGLLGTGARGVPRSPLPEVIAWFNRQPARKLAIDIPSGVDCDTGQTPGAAIRADHTCTFVANKPGLIRQPGATHAGVVHVCDIGVPRAVIQAARSR